MLNRRSLFKTLLAAIAGTGAVNIFKHRAVGQSTNPPPHVQYNGRDNVFGGDSRFSFTGAGSDTIYLVNGEHSISSSMTIKSGDFIFGNFFHMAEGTSLVWDGSQPGPVIMNNHFDYANPRV